MDLPFLLTLIAASVTIIGFVYGFLRNFQYDIKKDINAHIDRLEKRMDSFDKRMDSFESKMTSLEERMFWAATGKKLEDAILEERMKKPKTNP